MQRSGGKGEHPAFKKVEKRVRLVLLWRRAGGKRQGSIAIGLINHITEFGLFPKR